MENELTDDLLVSSLDKTLQRFQTCYIPLNKQETNRLERSKTLLALEERSIKNNLPKKRAHRILTILWRDFPMAYLLCAIATTHDRLGTCRSLTYPESVARWWAQVQPPENLTRAMTTYAQLLPPKSQGEGAQVEVSPRDLVSLLGSLVDKQQEQEQEQGQGQQPQQLCFQLPRGGFPLPSVQIGFGEFTAKMELSIPLAHTIMTRSMKKRGGDMRVQRQDEENQGAGNGASEGMQQ